MVVIVGGFHRIMEVAVNDFLLRGVERT
jgi:hypothetical protein